MSSWLLQPAITGSRVPGWSFNRIVLSDLTEDDTRKVLRCYQQPIAAFVHAQMQQHWFEETDGVTR